VLRFRRRIGPWCCVRGNPTQRLELSKRFPDLAKLIGRRSAVFFGIAVTRQSLRAFFKRRGFTAQVRENLAGEME
jgi:hypothetical protein